MALTIGSKLGPYEILSPLGAGGMGEVYRARDTKLGREVAIKALPDAVASDKERVARFEREAKLLASLNHPNIAGIYGLESGALVLELVEGPTLAERIDEGPIRLEEALAIARQIADALEAGHEAGIVHRDLKPSNIKVKEDGTVKVLDYGLAKALEGESSSGGASPELSQSPTLTRQTELGVILGTAAYMSPEQAKGKRVDRRADIWAFGAVLYEMLTGKRAFRGEDVSETLAFVLTKEPDWDAIPPGTPEALRRVVRLCLTKDPKRRLRDIGDVALLMEGAFETVTAGSSEPRRASPWIAALLALLGASLAALAAWNLKPEPVRPLARFVATPPSSEPLSLGPDLDVAISPDGTRIVYPVDGEGGRVLVVRALNRLEVTRLTDPGQVSSPFVSPDGKWVGYFDGAFLRRVSIDGGPSVIVCELPSSGAGGGSWGEDGNIVFSTGDASSRVWRVAARGGEVQELTEPDDQGRHQWPEILPGRRGVLFAIRNDSGSSPRIAVWSREAGRFRDVVSPGTRPRYLTTGHIVYAVEGTLRAVGFDIERLEVTSDPMPVLEPVVTKTTGAAEFAISNTGSLVYVEGRPRARERTLVWVDRQGREEPLTAPPRSYFYPRLSPDGSRLALDIRDEEAEIWIWEFAREALTRVTFDPSFDTYPVWTPDGRRVAFSTGDRELAWKAADGTGPVERIDDSSARRYPYDFSPDGKLLVYREDVPETGSDLGLLSLDGRRTSVPLLSAPFQEQNAEISPDGLFLAYDSDETGQREVYARPFPNVDDNRWRISRDGGSEPLWSRTGREIFYRAPGGEIMAVRVSTEAGFGFGNPEPVVGRGYFDADPPGRTYDVSLDGERFLMIKEAEPSDETSKVELIFVLNWVEELKRLVPAR